MSVEIMMYAEEFNKETNKWEIISEKCYCDNFKWYLNDYDDYTDFRVPEISDLSDFIKKDFKLEDPEREEFFYDMRIATIEELRNYANKFITKYTTTTKNIFLALGLAGHRESDDDYFDNDKYDDDDNIRSSYNPLTFPVSKELIEEWNTQELDMIKAREIIGICDTILCQSKLGHGSWDEQNVRVIMFRG